MDRLTPEPVSVDALPPVAPAAADGDPRMRAAWLAWLNSLASDACAAAAAAHLYAGLTAAARDAWIQALSEDVGSVESPRMGVYGPLLIVESDPARLAKIRTSCKGMVGTIEQVRRALHGTERDGTRVVALVMPLYLKFVRVLCFRFHMEQGFEWARQDPLAHDDDAPDSGDELGGAKLYPSSARTVIDELAHAVLAHRRSGRELPQLLHDCSDLFSAQVEDERQPSLGGFATT